MAKKEYQLSELTSLSESGLVYIIQSNRFSRTTKALANRVLARRRGKHA